jgi:UDPglucose--hexose-1-phosphate uridylyltransferase
VIHSPRHVWTLADFSEFPVESTQLHYVAQAWRNRAKAAKTAGLAYLHAFINEGQAAGASLSHSHSQLAGLEAVPSEISAEMSGGDECTVCSVVKRERREGTRVVEELHGVTAVCPYASRVPYEVLIAPAHHQTDGFSSKQLSPGLSLLAECVRRLHILEGRVPFNAWLHTSPFRGEKLHWHIHLVPRLTVFAGLELGAGLYVNELSPERAAKALRGD